MCAFLANILFRNLTAQMLGTIAKIVMRRGKSTIQFFIKLKTIFHSLKYMCLCVTVIKFTTYKHVNNYLGSLNFGLQITSHKETNISA